MKSFTHLAIPLLLTACPTPGPVDESTDGADGESSSSESGSDTTTGDGDGDGDGDACLLEPTFGADSNNMRWVTFETWPAWAQFAEPIDLQEGIGAGTLVPVDLGLDAECFEIDGFAMHTCVFEVECVELVGYPLSEVSVLPDACAPVGGAWDETGIVALLGGGCFAAVGDFAVRVRVDAPVCEGPAGSIGCECVLGSCLDGLTCKSDFCSPG
jgi:hypothetical protein